MDSHSSCRELLKMTSYDLKLKTKDFSVTKLSFGYEVKGPKRHYFYTDKVCCKWGARAYAMYDYVNFFT